MKNLSFNHYKKAIGFYLIIYFALAIFMILLPIIESDFWLLYLAILGILFIIILPFLLSGLILMAKANRALENKLEVGRIIDFESGFSIVPMPKIALKLKMNDGRVLITNCVLNPKNVKKIKGHEAQVAINKNNKVYLVMIF